MGDKTNLIIFGTGKIAEVAYYYFTHDLHYKEKYNIVGFTEEMELETTKYFYDIKVYNFESIFESIKEKFSSENTVFFAPISARNLNKFRERIYNKIKQMGYKMISYISSKATVLTEDIGDNCFILEDNTIQPFVKIGNNCVLWSGNHIGHHTQIGNNVFITSHVVISGMCNIEDYTYIGVNSSIKDQLVIAKNTVIGMSACVTKNTESYKVYIGIPAKSVKDCDDNIEL